MIDRARRILTVLGALLLVGGLGLGGLRVVALASAEVDAYSLPTQLEGTGGEPHRELVRAEINAGSSVLFEVCAEADLDESWVGAVEFMVWHPEDEGIVIEAPVDAELLGRVRRAPWGSCLTLGRGDDIPIGGTYAIEAVWAEVPRRRMGDASRPEPGVGPGRELPPSIRETPLVARIAATSSLGDDDFWTLLFVLAGALALSLGLTVPPPVPAPAPTLTPRSSVAPTFIGTIAFILGLFALAFVPFSGSVSAYGRGLVIAALEVGLALALVPPLAAWTRTQRLGLLPPKRLYLVAVAPILGVLVAFLGNLIGAFVPSTSEASIESLVAFSSGALALGLVSVVVPVAEELFFRGLIFGNLERRLGGSRAFLVTIVLFALAHLPQQWGNWGAASSVLFAGVVFTALRWRSGSTLVPILAHLAHNAILVFSRF